MAISSLFYGMEAYLDGDVEINNNISTPEDDEAMADQSAEVASDLADASAEDKDTEIQADMFVKMFDLCAHVKKYGIDRTFLSIYGSHGELDRVCNMQFPSLESMVTVGDPYSKYSTAFIAAMEDGNETWWQWIKRKAREIWEWIKEKANKIWEAIKGFFDFLTKKWHKIADYFKKNKNAGSNSPDAKDCAEDLNTAAKDFKTSDEANKKAADDAGKTADAVIAIAKEVVRVDPEQPEQVEEVAKQVDQTTISLGETTKQITVQLGEAIKDQEALDKRLAEATARNAKRRTEEKAAEAEEAAKREKNYQNARTGELAFAVLSYLRIRDIILGGGGTDKQKSSYLIELDSKIEDMLGAVENSKRLSYTEDGKKIITKLIAAAGKLKNVQDLILNGVRRREAVDKELLDRVMKILREDKRIVGLTNTAKDTIRNSKEKGISSTVASKRNIARDKDEFDRMLQ